MMDKLKVSVIIPALNEEDYIEACLSAIAMQDYKNYEIIVVDNGSTDRTISIAKRYTKNVFLNSILHISGLRNLGASKALGDILAFLDSDCVPAKAWLSYGVARLKNNHVGVTGCYCQIPSNSTWVQKAWSYSKPKRVQEVNFIGTANFFVLKRLFRWMGGFNERIETGEDYEFCQRVKKEGYKVISDDNIKVIHLRSPKTLGERLRKEIWYGLETRRILRYNRLYYPFIASLIFFLLLILIIVSVFCFNAILILSSIFALLLLLCVISFKRCYNSGSFRYFFALIPIYFVYLAGRTISLLQFLKK